MKTTTAIAKQKTLKPIKTEKKCIIIVFERDSVFLPWASKEELLKDFQEYEHAFNTAIDIAKNEKAQVVKIYELNESKWKELNKKLSLRREDMFCEHVIFELYAHRTFSL